MLGGLQLILFLVYLIQSVCVYVMCTCAYSEFSISPLSQHSPDVTLNFDDGRYLAVVLPTDKVATAACLKSDYVTTKMFELMGEYAGSDESLKSHVTCTHGQVVFASKVGSSILLDGDGGGAHSQVSSPMVPE